MTREHDELAEEIARRVAERLPAHACFFSEGDRADLKWFCEAIRECRKQGLRGLVVLVVGGLLTLLALGFRGWLGGLNAGR